MSDISQNLDPTTNTVTFEGDSTRADLWMRSNYGDRTQTFHLSDDRQAIEDFKTAATQENFLITTFP